jgi:hypothetical protein
MKKLYAFIGDASHRDSLDGLDPFIVIADDAPTSIVKKAKRDSEEAIVRIVDRVTMDSINKSIEMGLDTHGMGDGYLLDLTDAYDTLYDKE